MADISRFNPGDFPRPHSNAGTNAGHARGNARQAFRREAQQAQEAAPVNPANKSYAEQEEVSFRARVMDEDESPENIRSLSRLKRIIDTGQPLRGDVPRGYYLNLKV